MRGERQGYKGKLGTRAMEASVGGAEGRISEDDLSKENPPADMQREKGMEHPPPPPEIAENRGAITKAIHTHRGITRRRKEEICEPTTAENFSKFMTDTKPQMQEAQETLNTVNTSKSTLKHCIQTAEKDGEKGARGRVC